MSATYKSMDFWRGEVGYIEDAATFKKYENFNNDEDCFIRYCIMQADTAIQYGFIRHAEEIQRIVKELQTP